MIDDEEEIARLLQEGRPRSNHYRPLDEAADEFIAWAERPQDRIYTGIEPLDRAMRGTAPGELTLISGFTHSGKTLLVTEMLIRNRQDPDGRGPIIAVFTPDETRPLVLTKLTAAVTGVGAIELERRIQEDDASARALLRDTARSFSNLAVFDDTVSTITMDRMLEETAEHLGRKPQAAVFDYARLLQGVEEMEGKVRALKDWGKRHHLAMFVITQSSRSSGAGGKKQGIDSAEYGGEALATHMITVRRKKYALLGAIAELENKLATASNQTQIDQWEDRIRELRAELLLADDTVTVSLVKNKRPPSELVDDMDFKIERATGRLVAPSEDMRRGAMSARTLITQRQMFENGGVF